MDSTTASVAAGTGAFAGSSGSDRASATEMPPRMPVAKPSIDADEEQRSGETHDRQPDGVRRPREAMVQPAEQGRQNQKRGNDVEDGE